MRHSADICTHTLVFLAGLSAACDQVEPASKPGHHLPDQSPAESNDALDDAVDPASSEECEPEAGFCGADGEIVYDHPLQGVDAIDGLYPFVDFHRTSNGGTYALVEGGKGTTEEEYVAFDAAVVELETRAITQEELDDAAAAEIEGGAFPVPSKIGKRLAAALEQASDAGALDEAQALDIVVHRPWTGTVNTRLQLAIAQGLVDTRSDRETVRQEIADELAEETAEAVAPLLVFLQQHEISPEFVGDHISSVSADVPLSLVEALAARSEVKHVDLPPASALGGADGQEKAEAMQFWPFWHESYTCGAGVCNYDGENGNGSDIHVAVVDLDQFHDEHKAFRESTSTTLERIAGMWDCDGTCSGSPLADASWTPPEGPHGTGVLGALLGDARDTEDSAITDPDDQEQHSAAGGEARVYLYDGEVGDIQKVLNHIDSASVSPKPHFALASQGDSGVSPDFGDCNGTETLDEWIDQNFINGYGYFTLMGNDLDDPTPAEDSYDDDGIAGSTANCTAWDPASAMGAFAVGAYDGGDGGPSFMRHASAHAESAWGGSTLFSTEGRFRSVVNLVGPWDSAYLAASSGDSNYAGFSGTSFATPTVGSLTVAFIDMMKNYRGSSLIDDPGMFYAWMLNMGDRATAGGISSYATSGFHSRMGAGHAALRFVGNVGMDTPWYWYHYETCIDNGTTTTLTINGGSALSSSVDAIRATVWWFDRRFSSGTAPDNINMYLKTTGGSPIESSTSAYDNKERVFADAIGGQAIKIELTGASVTSDGEGCGTNSMRVWATILIEDSDRNDADGPTWDGINDLGVQPL